MDRRKLAAAKRFRSERGFILHEGTKNGHDFVAIATMSTSNVKTGDMIQIWFLLKDVPPMEAVKSGIDADSVCAGCPMASGNGCYVQVWQAPSQIWKSYRNGRYGKLDPKDYELAFLNRKIRFGAYGNPSLLPISKIKAIAKASSGWTGYFHDWREMDAPTAKAYGRYFMASTESDESYCQASDLGLRSFHVSGVQPVDSIECLADSKGIQCADCKLCAGTSKKRLANVWIAPHGGGKNKVLTISAA